MSLPLSIALRLISMGLLGGRGRGMFGGLGGLFRRSPSAPTASAAPLLGEPAINSLPAFTGSLAEPYNPFAGAAAEGSLGNLSGGGGGNEGRMSDFGGGIMEGGGMERLSGGASGSPSDRVGGYVINKERKDRMML